MKETGKIFYGNWADFHLDALENYSLEQIAAYVFAIDAVNFCFWPRNPSGHFEYEHMARNFEKLLQTNPAYFTAGLDQTTSDFLRTNVFNTPNEFALLEERARLLREVGNKLKTGFMSFLS